MAYLEIININKSFGKKQILKNISLSIDKSNFISLLGLSGCGKTTLLRIIAGLELPDSGEIILDGKTITNLPTQERNMGIVFQNYALFPHMNVFENIAYGLKIKKYSKEQIKHEVEEVLHKINLFEKVNQNVSQLSGGEQQRVALARAIVFRPQVLLLDEPLSNLDHSLRIQARNEIKRLQNELGITTVYVTHDQTEALALSDKIALLDKGNFIQIGNPKEIYFSPKNIFTANFIGHFNIINADLALQIFKVQIKHNKALAILPEHLQMHKTSILSSILIKDILFTGIQTEYVISADGFILKSIITTLNSTEFKMGEHITISTLPENMKTIDV